MLKVNSKKIEPGDTFLALVGEKIDGHDYIEEAIDKGAACIIASHGEYGVKTIIKKDTRTYLSNYLKELYMEKLNKVRIIGITGSKGKTSVGELLSQLLNKLNSKTAYIGTNGFKLEGKTTEIKGTTPDIYDLYELINEAIDKDCENIVIEISSRAILKRHIEGLRFDMAIFTNFVKNDDKNYLNTKIEPFKMLKRDGIAIINKKDPNNELFSFPQNRNVFYGGKDSDYKLSDIGLSYDFSEFKINDTKITVPLIGSGNVYNYLAVFAALRELDFDEEEILKQTKELDQVDGRMQTIKHKDNLIIVDYAYDVPMIKNVIKLTKELCKGNIYGVIGCGGDARQEERPKIGKTITNLIQHTIFTTDNPRHEEPEEIINEIIQNLDKDNYEVVVDRKEAIKKGISLLKGKDILLILGKGHEDSQIFGNDKFSFKDYVEVQKLSK